MKNQQYFEGILQLRNPDDELIDFIKNQFENNPHVWIAKEERLKNGIDIYVSSNRFLLALGKKIKKKVKGELKTSKRLYGVDRQTSKLRYRATVLFRL